MQLLNIYPHTQIQGTHTPTYNLHSNVYMEPPHSFYTIMDKIFETNSSFLVKYRTTGKLQFLAIIHWL